MYSHEIEELLKLRNYLISVKEYLRILETSPQINHIKYENDEFICWTTDNYKFVLKVERSKNE